MNICSNSVALLLLDTFYWKIFLKSHTFHSDIRGGCLNKSIILTNIIWTDIMSIVSCHKWKNDSEYVMKRLLLNVLNLCRKTQNDTAYECFLNSIRSKSVVWHEFWTLYLYGHYGGACSSAVDSMRNLNYYWIELNVNFWVHK